MKRQTLGNKLIAIGILTFVCAGCEDMTTDQYREQVAQAAAAKNQAAFGTFTGSLTSTDTNASMGGVEIDLTSNTQPAVSSDGTTTSQANIGGKVSILGGKKITLEAPISKGDFDPSTGVVSASVSIDSTSSANPQTFTIQGTISGNNFNGTIISDQFPSDGVHFSASRNGALPSAQALANGPSNESGTYYTGISDTTSCNDIKNGAYVLPNPNKGCAISMTVQDSLLSVQDRFADFIIKTGNVIVSVTQSDYLEDSTPESIALAKKIVLSLGFGGPSSNAQLDRRNGIMTCQSSPATDGSGAVASLDCREDASLGNSFGSFGWNCTFSGNQRGMVHSFSLSPAQAPQTQNPKSKK